MADEKRLIDVWDLIEWLDDFDRENTLRILKGKKAKLLNSHAIKNKIVTVPRVDAVEAVHGRWELTVHEEHSNFRWNVTAECSECLHSKGEIYAGFFTGFPKDLARDVVLDCAKSVKLDNYCPNCGAKMDGDGNG